MMKNHMMKTIWLDVKTGWKQALLSYNTKTLYFSNSEHYLSGLIVKHLRTKLKRISVKQALTELRQKFWLCQSRDFVWKVLKNCFLCRKHEVPLFQYPITPSLRRWRLFVSYSFYTTGIDSFGPLYVKLNRGSKLGSMAPLHKVCHFVHMSIKLMCDFRRCSTVRRKFIYSKHQGSIKTFIPRLGFPSYVNSDVGRTFGSIETW